MEYIEVGKKVRVENSGNDWWGEIGMVTHIDLGSSFSIVYVDLEYGTEDSPYIVEFSENELELVNDRNT